MKGQHFGFNRSDKWPLDAGEKFVMGGLDFPINQYNFRKWKSIQTEKI